MMAFAGGLMFSGCPFHSCERDISRFGRNVHSRMNWLGKSRCDFTKKTHFLAITQQFTSMTKKYLTHMSNKIKDIVCKRSNEKCSDRCSTPQVRNVNLTGVGRLRHTTMCCDDVYSHLGISASYTIHWGTITQYLCVYACTNTCVRKTCTNHGSHTMMSPTESRISGLMCHNLTSTIWMTVSSLLSWWFASICQTRAPKPWWWMRGRQSDRYDWLISHLQEGCSNVDVAGAVVVALTVGQCFSALILEALLPRHAWFKWSAYHLITSLLFGSGGRRVARNWTEKHCSRSNSSCVSSINIITNLQVSVN